MFEPTGATPLATLTSDQRRSLRQYYRNCSENGVTSRHPLEFALVMSGVKPAATMHPTEEEFPDDPFTPAAGLQRLCETVGLSYRQFNGWWFVALSEGRLDMLPTGGRGRLSPQAARRLGVILGYPLSVVDSFIESEGQLPDPQDSLRGQHSPEDIADVAFLSYRMPDAEVAMNRGQRVRRKLEGVADAWNVPELEEFTTVFYREALEELRVKA